MEKPEHFSVVMLTADRKIDRRIIQQADSLQAAGWTVTIVAMPTEKGDIDVDPRIIRVGNKSSQKKSNFLKLYHSLRKILPKNNQFVRMIKQIIWRYFVDQKAFYLKCFEGVVSQLSADVFVAHDLPMLHMAVIAAKHCNAKLVYDSHEFFCERNISKSEKIYWKKIEQEHIACCDVVITVNQSIAKILEDIYGIPEVKVIYNSAQKINVLPQEPQKEKLFHHLYNLPHGKKIVLYQGNIVSNRNIETLIMAMSKLKSPNIILVILGEGPLQIKLERIVRAKKLSHCCYFHPMVAQDELLKYTASADAGIIPYLATCLNHYYCTPNKLFEFIAAGLPIISSDLPEIRKIIIEHNIGLVGKMDSSEDIAMLIESFFMNETHIQMWRDQLNIVKNEICWEQEGKKLLKIFDTLKKQTLSEKNEMPIQVDITWLKTFENEKGRPLRILHVGNIANNAYLNAKHQRRIGIEADVLCGDAYHIMGCPEWEEAYITDYGKNDYYPIFNKENLNGYKRPEWFAQGPFIVCCNYLREKQKGNKFKTILLRFVMEKGPRLYPYRNISILLSYIITLQFKTIFFMATRFFKRFILKTLGRETNKLVQPISNSINNASIINYNKLIEDFNILFPDRTDKLNEQDIRLYSSKAILHELSSFYDVIQCYGVEPIWAVLAGIESYVAFEHGTLRTFVFENNSLSRLNSLAYRKAQHVFVTNGDCLENTKKLGIKNYSGIAHPVESDWEENELIKINLKMKYNADILLFCPIRHDWDVKGTDVHLRAFPLIRKRINKRIVLLLVNWGQDLEKSRLLLKDQNCENDVLWLNPLCRLAMIQHMQAADVVLDQMALPHFGATAPQSLAVGAPVIMSYEPDSTAWLFKDAPPILSAHNPNEIALAVLQACDPQWKKEYKEQAMQWFRKFHHIDIAVKQQLDVYKRVVKMKGNDCKEVEERYSET